MDFKTVWDLGMGAGALVLTLSAMIWGFKFMLKTQLNAQQENNRQIHIDMAGMLEVMHNILQRQQEEITLLNLVVTHYITKERV